MGIKERRSNEKAEMKKKIMDAAVEIIHEQGYEKLSIRKIAARIEYSPTTIYIYYKDKAEIIADMSGFLYHKVLQNVAVSLQDNKAASVDQQVCESLFVFIRTLVDEPEMAKAVIFSGQNVIFSNENSDTIPGNEGISTLEQIISKGIEQKIFKPGADKTGWMLISALLGFVISAVENEIYQHEDFDGMAKSFAEILTGGIRTV